MSTFNLVGNRDIIKRLESLILNNKFPHAVIIEGLKGTGKKTLAYQLARSVICDGNVSGPCGVCTHCVKSAAHSHPDISVISGGGKTGAIPVDVIREIRKNAYIRPSEAKRKVYILTDVDSTLIQAQNAFLKLFEEPPANTIMIITCETSMNLLETIRSRAVIFRLSPVSHDEAEELLIDRFPDADRSFLRKCALASNGCIGLAIDYAENNMVSKYDECFLKIVNALVSAADFDMLTACYSLSNDRTAASAVLALLETALRDAIAVKNGATNLVSGSDEGTKILSRFTEKQLLSLIGICPEIKKMIAGFVSMPLVMTYMTVRLRNAVNK